MLPLSEVSGVVGTFLLRTSSPWTLSLTVTSTVEAVDVFMLQLSRKIDASKNSSFFAMYPNRFHMYCRSKYNAQEVRNEVVASLELVKR
jgi:hypothetical protein